MQYGLIFIYGKCNILLADHWIRGYNLSRQIESFLFSVLELVSWIYYDKFRDKTSCLVLSSSAVNLLIETNTYIKRVLIIVKSYTHTARREAIPP